MVTSLQAAAVLVGLAAVGADVDAVVAEAGLTREELVDPERRLPREATERLWQAACRATGDPAFGLHVAELVTPGSFGVLEYIARSSRTLGDAVVRIARYARLADDAAEIAFVKAGSEVTIVPRLTDGWAVPSDVMEALLAVLLRMARELTGDAHLAPRAIELCHPAPADTREHARIFGVPIRFGAERNGMTFSEAQLAMPVIKADPTLSAILDRHAQELVSRLPPAGRGADGTPGFSPVESLGQRVRGLLAAELREGNPVLERIAATLGVSARTLRRRLKEEGTTLTGLLDELRHELALRYLEERALTLEAIAFELGFADARAFRRAFKRWTGRAPRAAADGAARTPSPRRSPRAE